MSSSLNVAVLGATGVVGQQMLRILEERAFPVGQLTLLASPKSAGRELTFRGKPVEVKAVSDDGFDGVDIALFSAGADTSRRWASVATDKQAIVIDNSSAWRMDPAVPLVVPEVNLAAAHSRPKGIIANPNCSTIQMVVALKPLHDEVPVERVVVSTYQAVSGAGHAAVTELESQRRALCEPDAGRQTTPAGGVLGGQLAGNLLMHWKRDAEGHYQEEELKMVRETQKILDAPGLRVSPTAVRVPVTTGHAESLAVTFTRPLSAERAKALLRSASGVELMDDFAAGHYPQPIDAAGRDAVLVGRVRQDVGDPNGLLMWVVGDNLRKGAALNAVQIAEGLCAQGAFDA